ncbi:SBBP repeat-containing protein, partial [Cylindrospermopsis raciborskii]
EVLIEEIGHFVDSRINQIDTPGDEGEYFAHLLTDQKLNKDEIDRLKAEDDRVVVTIDGKGVEVEQNTNPPDWTRLLGNVGNNEAATGLTMGTDGSVYVVGSGTNEGFIAKYKPDATQVWKKPYAKDYSTVTTGSDGSIYVANEGGFITKYKPEDGTEVWTKLFGTSSYDILSRAITTGSDGSIYVVGGTRESGSSNAVIAKYSSDGNLVWRRSLGTTGGDDFAYAVVLGSDGSIYAAGSTQGNLNSENYNGDSSGLFGDAFITKYTSDGTRVWTRLLGTSSSDIATSLAVDSFGYVYVSGATDGNLDGQTNNGLFDAFLSKYDPGGTKIWTKLLGDDKDNFGLASTSSNNSIYVGGFTGTYSRNFSNPSSPSSNDFIQIQSSDRFISKYNVDGTQSWINTLVTPSNDFVLTLNTGKDGSIYVGGGTDGNLDGQNKSGSGYDAFISKFTIATLAIAPANASQTEGNSGTKPFTFTVTRTGDTSGTSSANWAVTGSGINPANAADFGGILPSGTVNFAVGETSQTITINVSGDTTIENDEGFTVTLSNPIGAVLGTSSSGNTINESAQGGFGVTEKYYNISSPSGTFQLNYDMYGIPDRAEIFVNNVLQTQTTGGTNGDGFVSGSGSLNLNSIQLKAGDQIKVTITGNVQGTAWDYNVNYTGGLSSVNYIASGLITNDDNRLNSNVVTPKVNISTGLIFTAQSNGNITLDTNRGSATPDEVTSVQNGTKSNFNHIIGLYEVLNSQGEIKDDQGKTLKPEDANYALHALTTARVKNFTVQAGGNDTPSTATQLGSGVSVFAGKSYAPFVIANGGTYFGPGDQGIENFVAAEQGDINRFSSKDQYVRNLVADEGKDGDIFNNAPRFVQEPVAYFSFGVANPDKAPHFRSYGNGVYGFEDLPANFTQYSNNDFNDGVFALTLSI